MKGSGTPSATVPSPLPGPKPQPHPLPPRPSRLQPAPPWFPASPCRPLSLSSVFTCSPQRTSLRAGAAAAGELTRFAGLLGATDAALPVHPAAPQPSQLLLVAARLGSGHRGHHHRLLAPHATPVLAASLLRATARRRTPGVSGCHGDGGSPRPQTLSAGCPESSGVPRAQEGAEVRDAISY